MFQTDNEYVLEHLLLMQMHINDRRSIKIKVRWPFFLKRDLNCTTGHLIQALICWDVSANVKMLACVYPKPL